MDRFPQALHPWTGEAGFTSRYSPAILWVLDAVERLSGILPRPDGEVWFTGLLPYGVDHAPVADCTGYARRVDGVGYELVNTAAEAVVYRDGRRYASFPNGWRLVTGRDGAVRAIVGMSARPVTGALILDDTPRTFTLAGNERVTLDAQGREVSRTAIGVVSPTY
jgi:hypothetical protein